MRGRVVWAGGGGRVGRCLMTLIPAFAISLLFLTFLAFSMPSSPVESSGTSSSSAITSCPPSPPCHCPCQRHSSPPTGGDGHRLCVVVPFRDRFEELQVFVPHMDSFLRAQKLDFRILILNQLDLFRFNRASLINAGWLQAKEDVDLLPLNPALSYGWPGKGRAYHVASPEYHPRYNYTKFIGGILILTLSDYQAVNGMSNRYWGWGLEDDEFYLRLKEGSITLLRPTNLTTDRSNTFMHVHDRRLRKRDTLRIGDQKQVSRRRDRISGLGSVELEVLSKTELRVSDAPATVVNVRLHCNLSFSPWCQLPEYLQQP